MTPINDVLLVEDDLLLARALQRTLGTRGAQARHVARCATAEALEGTFRLGVFDIDLPDGDGVELARRLLGDGVVRGVVFYTACSHPARLDRARALGAVFVKSKHLSFLMELVAPRVARDARLAAPLH